MAGQDEPNWGKLASVGLEIAVGVGLGTAAGTWVDRKYNSGHWGVLIGAALGFAAGLYLLIKEVIRINKN